MGDANAKARQPAAQQQEKTCRAHSKEVVQAREEPVGAVAQTFPHQLWGVKTNHPPSGSRAPALTHTQHGNMQANTWTDEITVATQGESPQVGAILPKLRHRCSVT